MPRSGKSTDGDERGLRPGSSYQWTSPEGPLLPDAGAEAEPEGVEGNRSTPEVPMVPDPIALAPADVEAVTQAATEYYQAWFAGDGERIRACLHPALAKRTLEQPGTGSLLLHEDPVYRLVIDTASGEGTEFEPHQDVTVLDVFRDIASVLVRAEPFVEYLHLARFKDRWLVVNALYSVLIEP